MGSDTGLVEDHDRKTSGRAVDRSQRGEEGLGTIENREIGARICTVPQVLTEGYQVNFNDSSVT